MATTNPPQLDYTSRDYLSIRQDLLNAIPSFLPEWTSTSAMDFGIALLELFAWVADLDNYYIDFVANEAFLPTAQLAQSVYNLAYLIDYDPPSAQPATVQMSVTVPAGSLAVTIPQGSQFATTASGTSPALIFETTDTYTLPPNSAASATSFTLATNSAGTVVPITVSQIVSVSNEAVGASAGTPSQVFPLFNPDVVDNSVAVQVNEGAGYNPWTYFENLADADGLTAAFSTAVDSNGTYYVLFGDGVNGRIPSNGASIQASYSTTSGAAGNVAAGAINVDLTGLFSAVTNPAPALGGADAESIDQIRVNAPKSLTALHRAVSLQDYAAVALGLGAVAKAVATSGTSNSVVLYVHPVGGPYAASTLESLVNDPTRGLAGQLTNAQNTGYLDDKKPAPVSVTVLPPSWGGQTGYLPVVINLAVHVQPEYQATQVSNDVVNALDSLLDFGTMDFGALITESAVVHAAMAVPGVDWVSITEMRRYDAAPGTVGNIQALPYELISTVSPSVIEAPTQGGLS